MLHHRPMLSFVYFSSSDVQQILVMRGNLLIAVHDKQIG